MQLSVLKPVPYLAALQDTKKLSLVGRLKAVINDEFDTVLEIFRLENVDEPVGGYLGRVGLRAAVKL